MSGGDSTVPLSQSGLRDPRKPGYPFDSRFAQIESGFEHCGKLSV
jgi:hypothetical protein